MLTVIGIILAINLAISVDNHYKMRELELIQRFGDYPSCTFPNDPRLDPDECND